MVICYEAKKWPSTCSKARCISWKIDKSNGNHTKVITWNKTNVYIRMMSINIIYNHIKDAPNKYEIQQYFMSNCVLSHIFLDISNYTLIHTYCTPPSLIKTISTHVPLPSTKHLLFSTQANVSLYSGTAFWWACVCVHILHMLLHWHSILFYHNLWPESYWIICIIDKSMTFSDRFMHRYGFHCSNER